MVVELRRAASAGGRDGTTSPLAFEPIRQLRAHEYVAEQIRRHIALRLIRPGESLPSERELAVLFGVGRPTIQHAMRLLEADQLVEARRGRGGGTFVRGSAEDSGAAEELMTRVLRGRKELEELLVYRRLFEPVVAGEAARRHRRAHLTAMWRAVRGMDEATREPDYIASDTEFHIAVARATRNRFMEAAIEDIRLRMNDAMSLLPESDTWHRRLSGEHAAIIEAIESRDAEAAHAAMDLHCAASEQSVRALLGAISRRLAS